MTTRAGKVAVWSAVAGMAIIYGIAAVNAPPYHSAPQKPDTPLTTQDIEAYFDAQPRHSSGEDYLDAVRQQLDMVRQWKRDNQR